MKGWKMEKKEKEFRRAEYLLIFFIALVPKLLFVFIHHEPLRTPMDEMATLSTAAFGAGYDWSPLVVSAEHYYGGGFTIFLSPLFRLIEKPKILFGMILSIYAILQSISAPIACYISKEYMKIKDRKLLYLISVSSAYLVVARAQTSLNEHALIAVTWGVALFLCKLVEYENSYHKKSCATIGLFLLMSYGLTIHERTKMYWIVIVLMILVYYLFKKKWLVSGIPAIIAGGMGYYLAGEFVTWVKKSVWLWQEGEELTNTSIELGVTAEMLGDKVFYQANVSTLVGQIHTSFIFSCGLTAVAIVCFVLIFTKFYKKAFPGKKVEQEALEEENGFMHYIFVLQLFFTFCICGTIVAQCPIWCGRVMNALNGNETYGFKAYTYIRYYGIYLGPFFYSFLVYLYYKQEVVKKHIYWILGIYAVFQLLFLTLNLPYIRHNNVASEVYWPFALWHYFSGEYDVRTYVYLLGVFVASVFFLLFLKLLWKKKYQSFLGVFLGILLFQYGWNALYWDGLFMESYEAQTEAGYQFIRKLEENSISVPKEIYVKSTAKMDQDPAYVYQFLLKEYTLIPKIPDVDIENVIILCNEQNVKKVQKAGYMVYVLDENEFVATNSEQVLEYIKGQNLEAY